MKFSIRAEPVHIPTTRTEFSHGILGCLMVKDPTDREVFSLYFTSGNLSSLSEGG